MKTVYSVIQFPLITEEGQKNALEKKMDCARRIYNCMLSDNLKKYNEMVKTKKWRELNDIIREELSGSSKKSERLKEAYNQKNQILRENGFSDYDFRGQAILYSKYYQKHISSTMASVGIGIPMWAAFEKLLFGNGQRVSFKRYDDFMSLMSDNKSGIRFLQEEDGRYYVLLSNRAAKAKPIKLYIKGPSNIYEEEMLTQSKIKKVCIIRKIQKNKACFYVQLTVDRPPFVKVDANGEIKHPIKEDSVGIAIWKGTLCAVSSDAVYSINLNIDQAEFEKKRTELSTELEHLRRVLNQQNYNEDGTIKKGIMDDNGKKRKLHWKESNHYKRVKNELRELHRVHSVKKDLLQRKIVWDLLAMGNEFHIADTSFLTNKPEWDEEAPLPNSEYKKKKERRKSIQEAAPSMLLTKLDMKLSGLGLAPITKHKLPEELYWYHHEKGVSDKSLFAGETIMVNGKAINHTMYRAFLIRHFDNEIKGVYDQKVLDNEFSKIFCEQNQNTGG